MLHLDNWLRRRRVIYAALAFCAFTVIYVMVRTYTGDAACRDSRVAETLVNGAFLLAGAVIGSYCFAAVWDDTDKRKKNDVPTD